MQILSNIIGWASVIVIIYTMYKGLTIGINYYDKRQTAQAKTCLQNDYYGCKAFRSQLCSDGRCRYHCRTYCQCERRHSKKEKHSFNGVNTVGSDVIN